MGNVPTRNRQENPQKKEAIKKDKDYGQLGNRAIPPPSDLYTMKEHKDSDDSGDDDDKDGAYSGTGLSKEDKMKLLEIAEKNALNVHGGLNKNESIAMRHGGLTIEKLTEKCQRVADGKEDPVTEDSDGEGDAGLENGENGENGKDKKMSMA